MTASYIFHKIVSQYEDTIKHVLLNEYFTAFIITDSSDTKKNKCEVRFRGVVDNITNVNVHNIVSRIYRTLVDVIYTPCHVVDSGSEKCLHLRKDYNGRLYKIIENLPEWFIPYHVEELIRVNPLVQEFIDTALIGKADKIGKPKMLGLNSRKFKKPIEPIEEIDMREIYDRLIKSLPDENNDLIYKKDNKMNKIIDVGFGITAMNRQYILLMVSKDNFFMIYDSKTIQENVFLKAKNPLTKIF